MHLVRISFKGSRPRIFYLYIPYPLSSRDHLQPDILNSEALRSALHLISFHPHEQPVAKSSRIFCGSARFHAKLLVQVFTLAFSKPRHNLKLFSICHFRYFALSLTEIQEHPRVGYKLVTFNISAYEVLITYLSLSLFIFLP